MRQELDRRNSLCSAAVCGSLSSPGAQVRVPETPQSSSGVSVHSPGHRQARQRISHGIAGIILQHWLRDCFCGTWESQLTAGEGSEDPGPALPHCSPSPPRLGLSSPALWHQLLFPVMGWQWLQQLPPSSLCRAGSVCSFCPS